MEIEIKILNENNIQEFIGLISVFEEVFEMNSFTIPSNIYLQNLLKDDKFCVIVAMIGNEVIGGLTFYILNQYYSEKQISYLYDFGVKNQYQRQGVGKKLLSFSKEYFHSKGIEEIFVQAEKEDIHAIDFYKANNPSSKLEVVHFTFSSKKG